MNSPPGRRTHRFDYDGNLIHYTYMPQGVSSCTPVKSHDGSVGYPVVFFYGRNACGAGSMSWAPP
jgi:hypothetical protein